MERARVPLSGQSRACGRPLSPVLTSRRASVFLRLLPSASGAFLRNLLFAAAILASVSARAQTASIPTNLNEATVVQLQSMMASGQLTSVRLTQYYIDRIIGLDQNGPGVNAVMELNPDALAIAKSLDMERAKGTVRGPMHGIPVLLKDNIDTGDKMQTSAGSFALVGTPAPRDSTVAANLRAAGAVILGKTNLSEWANFRSFESVSGWAGRGGPPKNPRRGDRHPPAACSRPGRAPGGPPRTR